MFECDSFVPILLEGGEFFLYAFSFYFVLEVLVLLDCEGEVVQGIEVSLHAN
jgi:hypothetical protein